MQHTPTPWYVEQPLQEQHTYIACKDSTALVAKLPDNYENTKENAAFIVRAVNSYEALLEIVKELRYIIQNHGDLQLGPQGRHRTLEQRVLDTIKQAEGK